MSWKGNKRGGNYSRNKNEKGKIGERGKEVLKDIDENNPVIKAFTQYAAELDDKHDRYERIVKISRDITIESKRIIFSLHNIDKEDKRDAILSQASNRLNNLIIHYFRNIAKELDGQDMFQYLRAYTGGLQEFVEALTFYQYLKNNQIEHWSNLQPQLVYEFPVSTDEEENEEKKTFTLQTGVPPPDFMLGVADLTGELMRKCISNLGSGNIDDCFETRNFVRELYKGFITIGSVPGSKEFGKKLSVLRQSLIKMETVCYNIRVRGSEIPKHMLANVVLPTTTDITHEEEDEGFF